MTFKSCLGFSLVPRHSNLQIISWIQLGTSPLKPSNHILDSARYFATQTFKSYLGFSSVPRHLNLKSYLGFSLAPRHSNLKSYLGFSSAPCYSNLQIISRIQLGTSPLKPSNHI